MTVLIRRRLQKHDSGEVAGVRCGEEVRKIVLMIGRVAALADHRDRRRPHVLQVRRRRVVLKRRVMRDVVLVGQTGDARGV
jgi:hypothetical protein